MNIPSQLTNCEKTELLRPRDDYTLSEETLQVDNKENLNKINIFNLQEILTSRKMINSSVLTTTLDEDISSAAHAFFEAKLDIIAEPYRESGLIVSTAFNKDCAISHIETIQNEAKKLVTPSNTAELEPPDNERINAYFFAARPDAEIFLILLKQAIAYCTALREMATLHHVLPLRFGILSCQFLIQPPKPDEPYGTFSGIVHDGNNIVKATCLAKRKGEYESLEKSDRIVWIHNLSSHLLTSSMNTLGKDHFSKIESNLYTISENLKFDYDSLSNCSDCLVYLHIDIGNSSLFKRDARDDYDPHHNKLLQLRGYFEQDEIYKTKVTESDELIMAKITSNEKDEFHRIEARLNQWMSDNSQTVDDSIIYIRAIIIFSIQDCDFNSVKRDGLNDNAYLHTLNCASSNISKLCHDQIKAHTSVEECRNLFAKVCCLDLSEYNTANLNAVRSFGDLPETEISTF